MRRARIAIAAFALGLAPELSHAVLLGDVNLDGKVDSADYTLLNQYLAATATLTWDQRDAADVAPLGSNDLVGDGVVDSADAVVFDSALQGNDVDGDGLNVASETGGTTATNGSPFLKDTDRDSSPDNVDSTRGSFNANSAPSTPTMAITSVTGTTLGGTISSCTDSDGLPYPASCTQEVRVVAAGAGCEAATVISPITPSSGAWSATGLTAGVVYTVYGRSSDGALAACSTAATRSTTPTSNAPTTPYLNALSATTTSNPITLTGTGAPGQEIRVRVNGVAQDYVRSFVSGNSSFSPNPFIVASDGTFSLPVVLDDGVNEVTATAIGAASAESGLSNETGTTYNNAITRNPIGLAQESGTNHRLVSAGQIVVLTKGASPGTTGDYVIDYNLEIKANGLLVVQPGAVLKFSSTSPRRKLIVGGTVHAQGTETSRVTLTSTTTSPWEGLDIQSTARQTSLDWTLASLAAAPILLTGTTSVRPDLTVTNSDLQNSNTSLTTFTAISATYGGTIIVRDSELDRGNDSTNCNGTGVSVTDATSVELVRNKVEHLYKGFAITDSHATIESNTLFTKSCNTSDASLSRAIAIIRGPSTTLVAGNRIDDKADLLGAWAGHWARGVYIEDASPTVEDNQTWNTHSAIIVAKVGSTVPSPTIQNNTIRACSLTTGTTTPTGNGWGMRIRDGAGATITGNTLDNNVGSGARQCRGIYISDAGTAPITVSNNKVSNYAFGIEVVNASLPSGEDITISGNSIDSVPHTGIYLSKSSALVEENVVVSSGTDSGSWIGGIYATDSNPVITGNTVHGSYIGIRIDDGVPEITLNHVFDNLAGGIRLSATDSGTLVQGNRIENNDLGTDGTTYPGYGIRMSDAALATIDEGNVITANRYGIWVVGNGNPSDAKPIPIVNGNSIYENRSSSNVLQNFVTKDWTRPTVVTLDLTGNWWGVTSPTETTAGIVIGSVGSGNPPAVDISGALSGPDTDLFVGSPVAKIGTVDSRNAFFVPDPDAGTPPVAAISFSVYDSGASVVVRICPELQSTCTSSNATWSSSSQTYSVGTATVNWNGTDASGEVVAAEAYVYVIEATKSSVTQVINRLSVDANADMRGSEMTGTVSGFPTTFDTYRGDPFTVTLSMIEGFRPGRVVFDVQPLDANGMPKTGERFVVGPNGFPSGQPMPVTPAGGTTISRSFTWSGRNPSGQIISGSVDIRIRPIPMRGNVIIVDGTAPAITNASSGPKITADPYLVYDTYEQVASFVFRVDRLSDVTITLLPPNSWSDSGAPTWTLSNVAANTSTTFEFRGHKVAGMVGVSTTEARELLATLAQEGGFTLRIRAEEEVSRRLSESYVTLQVRH